MKLRLVIGNKAYSSWSLRPWILLRQFGIPFEETVIPMYRPTTHQEMLGYGPTGKVPVLLADDLAVWETLAICEFIADSFPDRAIWPEEREARAVARALSSEMHAGFAKLRQVCPTQFIRPPRAIAIPPEVRADVDRIEAAWDETRTRFGAGGPFLFGAFCAADAMFAPVVNRFHTYEIAVRPETRAYMDAVMALPAWREWIAGAEAEPWPKPDQALP